MSKVRTAVGEGDRYECGTWSTLPLWAALVILRQRPTVGKAFSFWEWKPSNPDHIIVRGAGECWWINKRDRIMW